VVQLDLQCWKAASSVITLSPSPFSFLLSLGMVDVVSPASRSLDSCWRARLIFASSAERELRVTRISLILSSTEA